MARTDSSSSTAKPSGPLHWLRTWRARRKVAGAMVLLASLIVLSHAIGTGGTPPGQVAIAAPDDQPVSVSVAPIGVEDTVATVSSPAACRPKLRLTPSAAAMIEVRVEAPCDGNTTAMVQQDALDLPVLLDPSGRATIVLPALSDTPTIKVDLPEMEAVSKQVSIPDFKNYSRAVLRWQGPDALQISVTEAARPDAVISDQRPQTIRRALSGMGGFLKALSSEMQGVSHGMYVYTLPAGLSAEMRVAVSVTEQACGAELRVQGVVAEQGAEVLASDMLMTLPNCDQVGETMVLDGLLSEIGTSPI